MVTMKFKGMRRESVRDDREDFDDSEDRGFDPDYIRVEPDFWKRQQSRLAWQRMAIFILSLATGLSLATAAVEHSYVYYWEDLWKVSDKSYSELWKKYQALEYHGGSCTLSGGGGGCGLYYTTGSGVTQGESIPQDHYGYIDNMKGKK